MITNEHITLINTTFAQYNVNLTRFNDNYAEGESNRIACNANHVIGRELHCYIILNKTPISFYLPLTFDKEILLNKVKEVLESKANSLQKGLDNINVLLNEVEDAFMIVIK